MLEMVRGDTARFKFQRIDTNSHVILTKADELFFTVKNSPKDAKPALQVTLNAMIFDDSDGTYYFTIEPTDTNNLDFTKKYYYDLEVIDGGVKTTIAYGDFKLKPEVTWAINEGES